MSKFCYEASRLGHKRDIYVPTANATDTEHMHVVIDSSKRWYWITICELILGGLYLWSNLDKSLVYLSYIFVYLNVDKFSKLKSTV